MKRENIPTYMTEINLIEHSISYFYILFYWLKVAKKKKMGKKRENKNDVASITMLRKWKYLN